MRLEELRERIKNEVILREGDVANYQWRQMGLTDEATKLGLSEMDFGRLVNQISLGVASDSNRIAGVKDAIFELASQRCKKLTEADIRQIMDKAELVHLTRSFVVDMWLPTLLQQMPDIPELPSAAPKPVKPRPVAPASPKESAPHSVQKNSGPVIRQPLSVKEGETSTTYEARNNFQKTSAPGPTTNPPLGTDSFVKPVTDGSRIIGQTHGLMEDYAAARTISTLLELAKKSISDAELWHGILSKGIRWTSLLFETVWKVFVLVLEGLFTLVVGLGRLLGNREFWRTTGAITRVVIVAAIIWKLWSWGSNLSSKKAPDGPVVQPIKPIPGPTVEPGTAPPESEAANTDVTTENPDQPAPIEPMVPIVIADSASNPIVAQLTPTNAASIATISKDYDKIASESGQYGEHQASKDGKWGLWQGDKWLIEPDYDDIGVFKNGKAAVKLNGQDYDIDRHNQRVSN